GELDDAARGIEFAELGDGLLPDLVTGADRADESPVGVGLAVAGDGGVAQVHGGPSWAAASSGFKRVAQLPQLRTGGSGFLSVFSDSTPRVGSTFRASRAAAGDAAAASGPGGSTTPTGPCPDAPRTAGVSFARSWSAPPRRCSGCGPTPPARSLDCSPT